MIESFSHCFDPALRQGTVYELRQANGLLFGAGHALRSSFDLRESSGRRASSILPPLPRSLASTKPGPRSANSEREVGRDGTLQNLWPTHFQSKQPSAVLHGLRDAGQEDCKGQKHAKVSGKVKNDLERGHLGILKPLQINGFRARIFRGPKKYKATPENGF